MDTNGDAREAIGLILVTLAACLSVAGTMRDIVFSPDGRRLFLSIGSGSNVALDMFPEPHLTMIPEDGNGTIWRVIYESKGDKS
jgi:glucose/arabinose dehydrogenase